MERRLKLLAIIFLISSVSFIGCEEDPTGPGDDKLVGTWESTAHTINGVAQDVEEGFTITFKADGTGTVPGEIEQFEWSIEGNQLTIIDEDTTTVTFTVTSTTLIFEFEEEDGLHVLTFTKRGGNGNGDEHDPEVVGTWDLTAYSVNGIDDPSFEGLSDWTYVFNDDGTGTFTENGETTNIEWSISGSQITIQRRDVSRVMTWGLSQTEYPDGRVITNLDFTYDKEGDHFVETYTLRSGDPSGTATVRGVVKDAETNALLAAVSITSRDDHSTTTDDNGSYSMEVGIGTITLTASKSGFEDEVKQVELSNNDDLEVNFELTPEGS